MAGVITIVDVRPLPDYRLALCFSDGQKRVFDVEPYLDHGVFRELRSAEVFNSEAAKAQVDQCS